jgi:hypothetical protein
LPPPLQGGAIALIVTVLGDFQSVLRFIVLPLVIIGLVWAFKWNWRTSGLIMASVFYYWVIGSLIHTHIRYGLPMHALLTIFAGITLSKVADFFRDRKFLSRLRRKLSRLRRKNATIE